MFSKKRLSIDIKGHILKVVEGELADDFTVELNKAAYLDLKNAAVRDGRIINTHGNADNIKRFLKKNKFSTKKVLLNISDNKAITRVVKLPKLPIDDLSSLIKMETPKYFPIDLSKFYVDYKILNTFNEDDKMYYGVLLCAIPQEVVDEYVGLIQACGLKPLLVDIHPNTLSRLYKGMEFEDILVIDGGINSADLLFLNRGNFFIYTTIPFELPDYSDLLRSPLEYDIRVLEGELLKLLKDVQNYIDFYLSRNEGKKIDKIYLTGDLALVSGIDGVLQKTLNIKTLRGFDQFVDVKKSRRNAGLDNNLYCGNIGAFLRGV